ncbi:MAG: hypothetical protein ACRDPB_07360 [Nocardioidaceae bacterium]
MSDPKRPTDESDETDEKDEPVGDTSPRRRRRRRPTGASVKAGTNKVRSQIASLIWLVAVICALFLAIGALLIALKANQDNSVVSFVLHVADILDGPFSRKNGIFTFHGNDQAVKNALVNWGIAAVVYLVVGKVLDRVIRP